MWFSLCEGKRLPVCYRCRRLESEYKETELHNRSWITPIVQNNSCADFMQKPEDVKRAG